MVLGMLLVWFYYVLDLFESIFLSHNRFFEDFGIRDSHMVKNIPQQGVGSPAFPGEEEAFWIKYPGRRA